MPTKGAAVFVRDVERSRDLDAEELASSYAYPESLTYPWTRVNFVTSVDGASSVEGRSGGLGHPADGVVFELVRDLADVVLVGAGTAVAEGYGGVSRTAERVRRRRALGRSDVPPLAVVTRGALPPDAGVITDTEVPTLVVTCATAGRERVQAYRAAGAEVLMAGEWEVDLSWVVAEFGRRGWRRIACEGGPALFGRMLANGLVDEVCLTVSPLLAGSGAGRIVSDLVEDADRRLRLRSVVRAADALLLRYHTAQAVRRLEESR
ncbi:pyrimidine reductase family protein [Actinopolyspora erythraea]|uniref:pyrimidine reductase family protein n=1 Tax=Actinopolyspora erythraea TaxID=414996 RepID=UPI001CB7784F|nr:pyrimidine reductase family protein [Actinopolyspora erythraea]